MKRACLAAVDIESTLAVMGIGMVWLGNGETLGIATNVKGIIHRPVRVHWLLHSMILPW